MMKRIVIFLLVSFTTLGILGGLAAFGVYVWASRDLPSITKVQDYRPAQVTTVYARDGSIMGYFFREKRFLVNLDNMSPYLAKAFIAAEDGRFYQHEGVDLFAIARAFIANLREGGVSQGGSTITQQLVKQLLVGNERSYARKIKEAILAYGLEKDLPKDQILYIYLNHIYLGNSSYGVEAAARTYFAKHANELTLAECAVLACLPKAPSANNPFTKPQTTKDRQRWVLGRMLIEGFITKEEHDAAVAQPLVYKSMADPSWTVGSWYLEEVRRQLIAFFDEANVRRLGISIDMYGEQAVYDGGLHVHTAMDPLHQRAAEYALRAGLNEADHRRGWRGSGP